ncbi:hypothetical protein J3R30DRAFT_3700800 [Lentinula aciculospora]|uniref:Uncharacterized protein n=1 Tax=Lentinula aciculospora TaxID=153920 RepID=A0A9W9AHQ9_9AGAR|nr:hypothetical protein J3R30DRAFT_3700800 [Lentinula aciculospora]
MTAPKFNRFKVQSTDVLQDARINVLEETSEQIIWFKERFLGDDEIIEHLVHNPTSTVCWIIHRPSQKGWYIRIRSPAFPPGVFIPLVPLPSKSPLHSDGALSFKSRTILPNTAQTISEYRPPTTHPVANVSTSSIHSYPPTPPPIPVVALRPPTPDTAPTSLSISASASSSALSESKPNSIPKSTVPSSITEFILAPTTVPSSSLTTTTGVSLISRAMEAFRFYEKDISNGYSFSLARVVVQSPPPYAVEVPNKSVSPTVSLPTTTPISSITTLSSSSGSDTSIPTCIKALPVLTFTDLTSTFTVGSLNGILQLDRLEAEMLGVDTSFWVAIALTYLDFLEERGSYLASLGD